jgi:hypothetical protein
MAKTFKTYGLSGNRTGKLNQPFDSNPKHGMTHHFQQKGVSSYTHKNQNFETQSYSINRELASPLFLTSGSAMFYITLKETT